MTIQMVQTLRHASSDILEIKCAILPDRRYEEVRPNPELWKSSVSFNFGRATHFFFVCYLASLPPSTIRPINRIPMVRDIATTQAIVNGQALSLSGTSGTDCSANSARAVPAQCPHRAGTERAPCGHRLGAVMARAVADSRPAPRKGTQLYP
mgnify:CR=1 FL=1